MFDRETFLKDRETFIRRQIKFSEVPDQLQDLIREKPIAWDNQEYIKWVKEGRHNAEDAENMRQFMRAKGLFSLFVGPVGEIITFNNNCVAESHFLEAIELAKYCVRMNPDEEMAWEELTRAYLVSRDILARIAAANGYWNYVPTVQKGKFFAKIIEDENNYKIPIKWVPVLIQLGALKAAQGLVNFLMHDPKVKQKDMVDVFFNISMIHLFKNELSKAVEMLEKACQLDPKNGNIWANIGTIYDRQRQLDKALECLEKAVQLSPELPNAWNNLGLIYWRKNQDNKAIEYIQKALILYLYHANAWRNLGEVYEGMNNKKRAVEYYHRYLDIMRDDLAMRLKISEMEKEPDYTDKN